MHLCRQVASSRQTLDRDKIAQGFGGMGSGGDGAEADYEEAADRGGVRKLGRRGRHGAPAEEHPFNFAFCETVDLLCLFTCHLASKNGCRDKER